jgi:hypothetical protein
MKLWHVAVLAGVAWVSYKAGCRMAYKKIEADKKKAEKAALTGAPGAADQAG